MSLDLDAVGPVPSGAAGLAAAVQVAAAASAWGPGDPPAFPRAELQRPVIVPEVSAIAAAVGVSGNRSTAGSGRYLPPRPSPRQGGGRISPRGSAGRAPQAVKTCRAVDVALEAVKPAVTNNQECGLGEAQSFSEASTRSPSAVPRRSSLASARIAKKEQVCAAERTEEFNRVVIDKLDGLRQGLLFVVPRVAASGGSAQEADIEVGRPDVCPPRWMQN